MYVHGARRCAASREAGPEPGSACVLPWVPSPPEAASDPLATYLYEAAALIRARVEQLADAVIRDRPYWARWLGSSPKGPERYARWRRQIEIIAAYRDQQRITTADPRHILGPYPDPDHSAFVAHRLAAQAIQSARALVGNEQARASTFDTDSRPIGDAPRRQADSSSQTTECSPGSEMRRYQQHIQRPPLEHHQDLHHRAGHLARGPQH